MKTSPFVKVCAFTFCICLLSTYQLVYAQIPVIRSVVPASAAVGATVTIKGANFNGSTAANTVFFGAVRATVMAATDSTLTTIVPAGATYQPITVTTNYLTAYSSQAFSVLFPGSTALLPSTFSTPVTYTTGSGVGNSIASDVDGDGRADLLTANTYDHSFSVLRNTSAIGSISFAARVDYPINTVSITELKMAVGDLNGDGRPDVAITNPGTNKLLIYKNNSSVGNISFSLVTDADENTIPTGVTIADFDVDGHPDLAVLNKRTVSIYRNTGTAGSLAFAPRIDLTVSDSWDHVSFTTGDLDIDGRPDIVIGEKAYSVIPVYENISTIGNIAFREPGNWVAYSYPRQVSVADVDQNGRPDVLGLNGAGFKIFYNTVPSNASYVLSDGSPVSTNNTSPAQLTAGNLNGDSLPDVVVSMPGSNRLYVYGNITSPYNYAPFSVTANYPVPFVANSITVADLDGDGKPDIAATGKETAQLAVLRNQQREPFIQSFTPMGGLSGTALTIKGLNFTGTTAVQIGGTPAASFTVLNDTTMTATVGGGSTGSVSITNGYGTGSMAGFVFGPPPVIRSFTPQAAADSMSVTITGSTLAGATAVSFGGVPARSFINTSDTSVVAIVGTGASGYIKVVAATGTDSIAGFVFLPPPVITSFSPASGLSGATITVLGKNFTGTTIVSFGEVPARSFTVVNDTTLQAEVGDGATGLVRVTSANGSGTKSGFQYLGPSITSFTPTSGGLGQLVTITGTNITSTTAVSFGGIPAESFQVTSPTTIRAYVGAKAISGRVRVTTPAGSAYKDGFIAPPIIASFSPLAGPVGTTVTIQGNNFSPLVQGNTVLFGNQKATVLTASDSILTVAAPAYTSYAPISVTANVLTGFSAQSFVATFTGGPLQPGSYSLPQSLPVGFGSTNRFLVNDMNLDGKPDIIGYAYTTAYYNSGDITISRNRSIPGAILFDSVFQMSSSLAATSITTADVTNDGLPELITTDATFTNSLVSVYKNNTRAGGTFSLGSPKYYATNVGPTFVATGDIDGDGKADMAVINNGGQTVSVFRNAQSLPTDTILFYARVDFAIGKLATALVIKDLDGDGKPDLSIISPDSSTLSVLRNTGKGGVISFAPRQVFNTGNSPRSIAIADLDGDGDMDIVTGNFLAYTISVFSNTSTPGSISFAPKTDMATKSLPTSLSINDLNGDGKPDISISQYSYATGAVNGIGIYRNTGYPVTMAFDTLVNYPTNASPGNHATTDIDGDGRPDIIFYGDQLSILKNKFNEAPAITAFAPTTASYGDTIFITGRNLSSVAAVGLGGSNANSFTILSDTAIRVVIYQGANGNVSVTTPYGTATQAGFRFITPPVISSFYPTTGPVGTVVTIKGSYFSPVADSNFVQLGAARATVVAATTDSLQVTVPAGATNDPVVVSVNGRTSAASTGFSITFSGTALTPADYYFDVPEKFVMTDLNKGLELRLSDLDGDGKNDIVVCGQYSSRNLISFKKNSSLPGKIALGPKTDLPTGGIGHNHFSISDMNGDGRPDATMSAYYDDVGVGVTYNNSTADTIGFSPYLTVPSSGFIDYSRTADMDGDGRPDIVATRFAAGLRVYRNISVGNTPQYANAVDIAQISGQAGEGASLLLTDFDGDGKTDIGTILYNKLTVFRNIGIRGTFSFTQVFTTTFSPGRVGQNPYAKDLDGDGKPDIVFSDFYGNSFSIYRNTSASGNISFAARAGLFVGSNVALGAVADIDGDGKPELFTRDASRYDVGVYKNVSTPGNIGFIVLGNYNTGVVPGGMDVGDIDGDGKPDIAMSSAAGNIISVLRNRIGEPKPVVLCPSYANAFFFSNASSNSGYRWQVNTGNGFTNIYDNENYAFTDSPLLKLSNIPSAFTGYQYRCQAGTTTSYIFELRFTNTWRGTTNTDWNNTANWTCGTLPDVNTDVLIESGLVIVNTNTTVRSLKVRTGATVQVAAGATLTVLR